MLQPLSEIKFSAAVWNGDRSQSKKWACNGTIFLLRDAISSNQVRKIVGNRAKHWLIEGEMVDGAARRYAKNATDGLVILGWSTYPRKRGSTYPDTEAAVGRAGDQLIAVWPKSLAFIRRAVGGGAEMRVGTPQSDVGDDAPVVFFRDGSPVAILARMRIDDRLRRMIVDDLTVEEDRS